MRTLRRAASVVAVIAVYVVVLDVRHRARFARLKAEARRRAPVGACQDWPTR